MEAVRSYGNAGDRGFQNETHGPASGVERDGVLVLTHTIPFVSGSGYSMCIEYGG
jgi:hypothetical protein